MMHVNFEPFPVIVTERLQLKEITTADVEALFEIRSDKNLMKYIARPVATSFEDVTNLIELISRRRKSNEGINWGIFLKDNPYLLGMIGFVNLYKEDYRAEIGYMLNGRYHRQGIVQEAFEAVVKYGYEKMNLHSIEATIHPDNIASARLLEKKGFTRDAYFKENKLSPEGVFEDTVIYSQVRPKG
jgi:ribosomal-protein-alanine N-acetyltransferase